MTMCPGIKRLREKEEDVEQLDAEADTDIKIANDVTPPTVEDTASQVLKHYRLMISRFLCFIIVLYGN